MTTNRCTDTPKVNAYRNAARHLERFHGYACLTIEEQGISCSAFCKKFKPTIREANEAVPLPDRSWRKDETDGAWGFFWGDDSHDCRVLAVCFMAAMVEAGDA